MCEDKNKSSRQYLVETHERAGTASVLSGFLFAGVAILATASGFAISNINDKLDKLDRQIDAVDDRVAFYGKQSPYVDLQIWGRDGRKLTAVQKNNSVIYYDLGSTSGGPIYGENID